MGKLTLTVTCLLALLEGAAAEECQARRAASVELGRSINRCGELSKEEIAAIIDRMCTQAGTLIIIRYPTMIDQQNPRVFVVKFQRPE